VTKCGTERASRHKRLGGHELRMPAPQAFGHPGNGQKCSACDEILTAARLMMEVANHGKIFFFPWRLLPNHGAQPIAHCLED
jgi:hypothetical protein